MTRTHLLVQRVGAALQSWLAVDLPSTGSLRVVCTRVVVPGRSGDHQGSPLLSPPDLPRDPPPGLPDAVAELARAMSGAVEPVFPRVDPRTRLVSPTELSSLPPGLAAWYRAAGPAWQNAHDKGVHACAPALTWRPAFGMHLHHAVAWDGPAPVEAIAVLATRMALGATFEVQAPPVQMTGDLPGLAAATGDAALVAAVARLQRDEAIAITVIPTQDLVLRELRDLLGPLPTPYLQFALTVPVGGEIAFSPAAMPVVSSRPRRGPP